MRVLGKLKSLACACVAVVAVQGGSALAAANSPAKHPEPVQGEPAQPALWKIANGKSTVYLLGSIHVLPVNFSWHTPVIDQAIAAADLFMFEANTDYATTEFHYFVDKNGYLPRGQTLHALLSPEAQKRYFALLEEMHLDPHKVDYLRPGLADMLIEMAYSATHASQHGPLELGPGVDASLVRYAKDHSKQIGYLETVQSQFDTLSALGGGKEIEVFEKTLSALDKSDVEFPVLLAAWARGDLPKLASLDHEDAKQRAILFDNRNKAWVPQIEAMLKEPATALVTVGAGHLAGSKSVIALLCARHWKVQRIQTGPTPPPPACER